MPLSIRSRISLLLLAAPVFVISTGFVLYLAYQESLQQAHAERLKAYIYGLLAIAEPEADGLYLPTELADQRLNQPQSGLLALVRKSNEGIIWTSPSSLGIELDESIPIAPLGAFRLNMRDSEYLKASFTAQFSEDPFAPAYHFEVWQSVNLIKEESRSFVSVLVWGLGAVGLLSVLLLLIIALWLLKPIRRVTNELYAMENASRDHLSTDYPEEIARLTESLNLVVDSERQQRERYRHSLGDLAHSLKTPLAMIRGEVDRIGRSHSGLLSEVDAQVSRIDEVITYQLQRASSSGTRLWVKPIAVADSLKRLLDALKKVYANRALEVRCEVDESSGFLGDQADFMEIAGNLIENAFKYTHSKVHIGVRLHQQNELQIRILDDGPGIPATHWQAALKRGIRLDSRPIGQGIGLAVAAELISSYQGSLRLLPPEQGIGTHLLVCLPGSSKAGTPAADDSVASNETSGATPGDDDPG